MEIGISSGERADYYTYFQNMATEKTVALCLLKSVKITSFKEENTFPVASANWASPPAKRHLSKLEAENFSSFSKITTTIAATNPTLQTSKVNAILLARLARNDMNNFLVSLSHQKLEFCSLSV